MGKMKTWFDSKVASKFQIKLEGWDLIQFTLALAIIGLMSAAPDMIVVVVLLMALVWLLEKQTSKWEGAMYIALAIVVYLSPSLVWLAVVLPIIWQFVLGPIVEK